MQNTTLITGATAGIGRATAQLLAAQKHRLILTGRRQERLDQLRDELSASTEVETLAFDVSNRAQVEQTFRDHSALLGEVTNLINNAGLARGVDAMPDADLNDWDEMIDTNIKGLLYMTRLMLPTLKKNRPCHIVNVGSVAGRGVYPGGGVYCATKFAVRALTEGLRMDLQGQGVRVTNISPGLVETEFSQVRLRDSEKAKAVYQGMQPLTAEDIAETIVWSLSRPQHVNIQEMVVYPTEQASMYHVHRTPEENA